MTTEVVAFILTHWFKAMFAVLGTIFASFYGHRLKKDYDKKEERLQEIERWQKDTYSKDETNERIDQKLNPEKEKLDRIETMMTTFLERSELKDNELLQGINNLNDKISAMNVQVAIIKTDVTNLKEDKFYHKRKDNNA